MADVYENAFLTIAATASKDSNGECFSGANNPFRARKLEGSILHVCQEHSQDPYIEPGWIRENFGNWPLLKRAWVFQERRLSTRIVHFTDVQLLWECHSTFMSESGDIDEDWSQGSYKRDVSSSMLPLKYPLADTVQEWHSMVADYSSLDLTFIKDRLPALGAIVQRTMKIRREDTYIAGVWQNSLLHDVMWKANTREMGPRPLNKVPTWSWASAGGPVWYPSLDGCPIAKKVHVTFTPVGPPQLGGVIDAAIVLVSYSCIGTIHYVEKKDKDFLHFEPKKLG